MVKAFFIGLYYLFLAFYLYFYFANWGMEFADNFRANTNKTFIAVAVIPNVVFLFLLLRYFRSKIQKSK